MCCAVLCGRERDPSPWAWWLHSVRRRERAKSVQRGAGSAPRMADARFDGLTATCWPRRFRLGSWTILARHTPWLSSWPTCTWEVGSTTDTLAWDGQPRTTTNILRSPPKRLPSGSRRSKKRCGRGKQARLAAHQAASATGSGSSDAGQTRAQGIISCRGHRRTSKPAGGPRRVICPRRKKKKEKKERERWVARHKTSRRRLHARCCGQGHCWNGPPGKHNETSTVVRKHRDTQGQDDVGLFQLKTRLGGGSGPRRPPRLPVAAEPPRRSPFPGGSDSSPDEPSGNTQAWTPRRRITRRHRDTAAWVPSIAQTAQRAAPRVSAPKIVDPRLALVWGGSSRAHTPSVSESRDAASSAALMDPPHGVLRAIRPRLQSWRAMETSRRAVLRRHG